MALPGRDRWRNKEEKNEGGSGGRGGDEPEIIGREGEDGVEGRGMEDRGYCEREQEKKKKK